MCFRIYLNCLLTGFSSGSGESATTDRFFDGIPSRIMTSDTQNWNLFKVS